MALRLAPDLLFVVDDYLFCHVEVDLALVEFEAHCHDCEQARNVLDGEHGDAEHFDGLGDGGWWMMGGG